ncbi:glycosyltransferase [Leuconostoc pseudomesenteroides]|uniref:glycosyltransferase n=1 Tax=Leuconostoc pseudomesenteroides TaxID=33968 RepID=UPI001669A6E6|nr:glycosyltransferase [Leuconostoc pseudomesenteroides]MCT4412661.1 glycosyltransferase family 2 protein [Leuconostoc pseudomesenteroides]
MQRNAVIILNYNNADETFKAVQHINSFLVVSQVVVVDNNSTTQAYQQLVRRITLLASEKVKIIRSSKNGGYAQGNNIGLNYLDSKNFIGKVTIMNPDVYITEINYNNLIESFAYIDNPYAFVSSNNNENDSHWDFTTVRKSLSYGIRHIPHTQNNDTSIKESGKFKFKKVDVLGGALLVADMETWKQVGYFDPHTFLYFEEEILQFKAKAKRIDSYLILNSIMIHKGQTSTDQYSTNFKKIINYEIRLNTSRDYYFSHYLGAKRLDIFLNDLFRYVHMVIRIIKRK